MAEKARQTVDDYGPICDYRVTVEAVPVEEEE